MSATPRRGRPPRTDGPDTTSRLLDAAATALADQGFDGATLQEIARRTGVTPAAIYNHFGSREDLLYAAGVRGLQQMKEAIGAEGLASGLRGIAHAYLREDMAETRRVLAELHLAGRRDARLARLLQDWHRTVADDMAQRLSGDDDPAATIKALFLLLLGLCHLDDLDAVEADPIRLSERVATMVDVLRPQASSPSAPRLRAGRSPR